MRDNRPIHRTKTALALVLAAIGGMALAGCADSTTTASCPVDGMKGMPVVATADALVRPASVADVLKWTDADLLGPETATTVEASTPRRLAAALPPDLDSVNSVERRKRAFVAIVLPLALRINESILADRRFVEQAVACGEAGRTLSTTAQARLDRLTAAYGVGDDPRRLRARLDMVPPSLLLAQAAIESGWGTSRFAMEGNALFGQRTTVAERGMRPQGLDDDASVHVAAFPHLLASVRSYVHNLNTQPAYRAFRQQRAALREQGRQPDGLDLASALTAYSERGAAYVHDVKAIIRGNRFDAFDGSALLAAGEGSDA